MEQLIYKPTVKLVGRPAFLGIPEEMGEPRKNHPEKPDQDVGTEAERLFETAGRVCYDSYGKGRGSESYHEHIQEVGHGSISEHGMWSFYLGGISRGLSHELVRHRVGVGISQRSTRYVDENESGWIVPPLYQITDGEDSRIAAMKLECQDLLNRARGECAEIYGKLVGYGQDILKATTDIKLTPRRKMARGAARSVLGQALDVQMIWSANLRTLLHVCNMRCTQFAESEIRVLFRKITELMVLESPSYFGNVEFRPSPDGLGPEIVPGTLARI